MRAKEFLKENTGFNQEAGIGIDGKSYKFKIRDLVAFAEKYPVTKVNPKEFIQQIKGRDEDPTQSMTRAEKADLQYPIIVVHRKYGQLWIADGTHRTHKAILNKLPSINAKIIPIKDMAPFDVEQGVAEGSGDKRSDKGDCFEVAGRAMIDPKIPGLKLVHAYVSGQGKLEGQRFPHAWNEVGDVVFDNSNGRNIILRKEQYYDIGKIVEKPGEYAVYNDIDAKKKMVRNKHYGPWDLK